MEGFDFNLVRGHVYDSKLTTTEDIVEFMIENRDASERDFDDPFYICDLGDVIAKDTKWRQLLPSVETFYAVKCNNDPVLVRLLVGLGRSFDCANKNEIQQVLDLGGSPDRIIYAHPYKQESHLVFARDKGVSLMAFDCVDELRKIKRVYPGAELVLRVSYDAPTAIAVMGNKFGCAEENVYDLMKLAKKIGMNVVGISFHVGSESTSPMSYAGAIAYSRRLFDFGRTIGIDMTLLDIGGGFPGHHRAKVNFEKFAEVVDESLQEHFPPSCGVRVIAEPGTFYVRSAVCLVANIITKRETIQMGNATNGRETVQMIYYANVGIYNSFSFATFVPDYFDPPRPFKKLRGDEPLLPSRVYGPTCSVFDCVFGNCLLPELHSGEVVLFQDLCS